MGPARLSPGLDLSGGAQHEAGGSQEVLDAHPLGLVLGAGLEVEQVGGDLQGAAALVEGLLVGATERLGLDPRTTGSHAVVGGAETADAAGDLLDRPAGGLLGRRVQPAANHRDGVVGDPVDHGRRPEEEPKHQRAADAERDDGQDAEEDVAVHSSTVSPATDTDNRNRVTRWPDEVDTVRFTRAELEAYRGAEVPDLLGPGTRLLFVGINPGLRTAATQTHFGNPVNRFWPALHRAGILDEPVDVTDPMTDEVRAALVARGIGISNLVRRATARADELTAAQLRAGAERLVALVGRVRPRVAAVLGVTAYRSAFGRPKPSSAVNPRASVPPRSGWCRTRAGSTPTRPWTVWRRRTRGPREPPACWPDPEDHASTVVPQPQPVLTRWAGGRARG